MEVPSHLAIIMDGNGRWANKRGLPRKKGHREGVKTLKEIVKVCSEISIPCLTVYAFSTENWKRPPEEVNFLLKLFRQTLQNEARELADKNVRIKIIGRRRELSDDLIGEIERLEQLTAGNDGLLLNIAFNYGGRAEIIDTVKMLVKAGDYKNINEKNIRRYLYNSEFPEVELLIRTGGERRISNFLLWEIAYAELYFTDTYWPDFSEQELKKAINVFQERERRFGGLN